jgi:ubiquinone/menaquinone biosynthesis C-methylase UbiE
MHLNSKLLFSQKALNYFRENDLVLEIGGNESSEYKKICSSLHVKWHTLELSNSPNNQKSDLHFETAFEYQYPFTDSYFDIVFSGQVAEHVKKIWVWLNELKRVTKSGGYIIIINPVSWPYHEDPVDCWRMYPQAMVALSEECGLKLIHSSWSCLEWKHFNLNDKYLKVPGFIIPGRSIANDSGLLYNFNLQKYYYNIFLSKLPYLRRFIASIQVSYDTITIMQKI